jgi:hypothetical protein
MNHKVGVVMVELTRMSLALNMSRHLSQTSDLFSYTTIKHIAKYALSPIVECPDIGSAVFHRLKYYL